MAFDDTTRQSTAGGLPASAAVERVSLKAQILSRLKAEIITGGLAADTVYATGTFAKRYGVSLTPVRESLLELEKDGLVKIITNVGFRIVVPTDRELQEALELRELVEVPTTARLAGKLTGAALEEAWRLCRLTRVAADAGDLATYLDADRAFHGHLIDQAGNSRIAKLIDELREAQRKPALRKLKQHGNLTERAIEHEKILRAIEAGDCKLATKLIAKHLELTRRNLS